MVATGLRQALEHDRARFTLFGYSVGLSGNGDTLGVGAYDDDEGRRGAVYVFTHNSRNLVAANACHGHEGRA